MICCDVNVLVYAFRKDVPNHRAYRAFVSDMINSPQPFATSAAVLSGFLRVVTHPRVFHEPSDLPTALRFAEQLRNRPNHVPLSPGPRHWDIFTALCRASGARGNLIADAYLAALAIEHGCQWITTDRDFARFADLNWRHPLQ